MNGARSDWVLFRDASILVRELKVVVRLLQVGVSWALCGGVIILIIYILL